MQIARPALKPLLLLLLLVLPFAPLPAAPQPLGTTFLDLAICPEFAAAPDLAENAFSYGGRAEACLYLPGLPLEVFLNGGVALMPLNIGARLDEYRVGAGMGYRLDAFPLLSVELRGSGGWTHAILGANPFMSESLGGDFAWAAVAVRAGYFFTPAVSAGIEAGYRYEFGLAGSLGVTLFTAFHFSDGRLLVPGGIEIEPLFPSLKEYYARHPVGAITLRNRERFPVKDVIVTLRAPSLTEKPLEMKAGTAIMPGAELRAPFGILLSDAARMTNQGGSSRGDIVVAYTCGGARLSQSFPVQIRMNENNAIVWDDDRKAAAFVTEKDPAVRAFAGAAISAVRKSGARFPSTAIRLACALFTALQEYGTAYVPAPVAAYSIAVKQNHTVDFLKYPAQTLAYRAGDCSDLTALYCSLLESAGIESGFITVPGHIYSAFSTGLRESAARRLLASAESLIFVDGIAWMPVETTLAVSGFDAAREAGSAEWKRWSAEGQAKLYSVRESWKEFPPSDMAGGAPGTGIAEAAAVSRSFEEEANRLVSRDLVPLARALAKKVGSASPDPRANNALGVLFCQYGRFEEAEAQFKASLAAQANVPAAVNLGTLYLMRGDFPAAVTWFRAAFDLDRDSQGALAGLVRALRGLGDETGASQYLARLGEANPALARALEPGPATTGRAASAEDYGELSWETGD
jgi:tetratricopeptide (TPR) repeat protein